MNRKLILLNVLLAGLLVWAGIQWRNQYLAAKARELKMRNAKVNPTQPIPLPAIPPQPPVLATSYDNVAQKLLLHPSRNPNIVVDPPTPPRNELCTQEQHANGPPLRRCDEYSLPTPPRDVPPRAGLLPAALLPRGSRGDPRR